MKPLLLFLFLCLLQPAFAQSLDYISVRKQNGRVLKNFYTGSEIVLQQTDGSYLNGPIQTIRNDSLFLLLYDIRYYPTAWGTYMKDTVATTLVGMHAREIRRILLTRRKSFLQRTASPLLMAGGAGYLAVNVLNGALFDLPLTDGKNLRRIGIAGGAFGLGFLFKKLFSSDGFSKKTYRIVYVDLSKKPV
jgi:hypothetical protein